MSGPPLPDLDRTVLIVVGAHPRAELHDRPIAARVRDALAAALEARWSAGAGGPQPLPMLLTDLWRLHDPQLAHLPQIAIGHPNVNALATFLADKLPPAYVIDGELAVQFDADAPEALALCWGVDHRATARAADEFLSRYLDAFADAVIRELI